MKKSIDEYQEVNGAEQGEFSELENEATVRAIEFDFLSTYEGRDVIRYGATIEDIQSIFLEVKTGQPGETAKRLNISERRWTAICAWLPKALDERKGKLEYYQRLQSRHVENPLFPAEFDEKVPDNFVSVFHLTGENQLGRIGSKGLQPLSKLPEIKKDPTQDYSERLALDKLFDKFAPEGCTRKESVYAYPDAFSINSSVANNSQMLNGGIGIEIKVDPKKARVANAETVVDAGYAKKAIDKREAAEYYWEDSMTLEEYLQLSPKERVRRFSFPEVLIPGGVDPKMMRVAFIKNVS